MVENNGQTAIFMVEKGMSQQDKSVIIHNMMETVVALLEKEILEKQETFKVVIAAEVTPVEDEEAGQWVGLEPQGA